MVRNILSIDVEEVVDDEFTRHYRQQDRFCRSSQNIPLVLELLKEQDVKATFFVLGKIAKKSPEVVKMILEDGHEVAFHGGTHEPLWRLRPGAFEKEVRTFKNLYPDCIGFRAPYFSLNNRTRWALRILEHARFRYDSSIFPTWTPLYGVYNAPTRPYRPSLRDISREDKDGGIIEFPLAVCRILGLRIPIAGGFWLRLFSENLIGRQIGKMNRSNTPAVLYIHTWELDHKLPELKLGFLSSFITYHNIGKAVTRLKSLLSSFDFTSFREYLEKEKIS